jgi:glutamine amidotransferase
MSKIIIIDYGAGNVFSVQHAIRQLGYEAEVTADHRSILRGDYVIFPGVGSAGAAMRSIAAQGLESLIRRLEVPFLGICLGMQLMVSFSQEEDTVGLGLLPGQVVRFDHQDLRVPHMGWNKVNTTSNHPLWNGIDSGSYFYFVHSYYLPQSEYQIGSTNYGAPFVCAVAKDGFMGVQFHPEKSGEAGLKLLDNFLKI